MRLIFKPGYFLIVIILSLFPKISFGLGGDHKQKQPDADWTILIFMNGDNNLEPFALMNFADIAKIGSTPKVNIVVQFDRIGKYARTNPQWSQTLRFRITKNMEPLPKYAVQDIGEADMGDGKVLKDFVIWGMAKYPAKHYMLDIWDHGQGYRFMFGNRLANNLEIFGNPKVTGVIFGDDFRSSSKSPYKSCSNDETDSDELYNRKIQDELELGLGGKKLDVIGFDCCLMSMVETTYAMRHIANCFVGSEELEPGTGWQYDDWLRMVVNDSRIDGKQMSKILVDSYRKRYGSTTYRADPKTTMAAIDLSQVENIAILISQFSNRLIFALSNELDIIKNCRNECANFAPNHNGEDPPKDYFFHIDFLRFCNLILQRSGDEMLKVSCTKVRDAVKNSILFNYAGTSRQGRFGASGVAIYFPPNEDAYKNDGYSENGYEKSNLFFPVEFVQKTTWPDFLYAYFKKVPK